VPPRRRCVGCGRIAPKSELLRIAAAERPSGGAETGAKGSQTVAVADPHARMPGRGAYLCRDAAAPGPAQECLALAMRRGGIPRALRRAIPGGLVLNDSELVESVDS
jgi:predicted RNA-binding protein YlxR (DUF448 family)